MRVMSKNRKAKFEMVMSAIQSMIEPCDVADIVDALEGVKISGMTVYLILMDAIEDGMVEKEKIGRKYLYKAATDVSALDVAEDGDISDEEISAQINAEVNAVDLDDGDDEGEIGMEPDDEEAEQEAAKMEENATDNVPF
jgi:predicted transcriptional regulator